MWSHITQTHEYQKTLKGVGSEQHRFRKEAYSKNTGHNKPKRLIKSKWACGGARHYRKLARVRACATVETAWSGGKTVL